MPSRENPNSTQIYTVTYQRQDQLDVAEVVEDFMQTGAITRSLVALLVVATSVYWIPAIVSFDGILKSAQRWETAF